MTTFAIAIPTEYGQMIVNRNDINQAGALIRTGRAFHHEEINLLRKVLANSGTNLVVLDVGANFGTHTFGLVPVVGEGGAIHAFEPQRIIFNMLAGSVALNGLTNVHCHNVAIGAKEGQTEIPQFDYSQPMNFGSIEFGAEQRESVHQRRGRDSESVEFVPLRTIDSFSFRHADLIKLDVEGMEEDALLGAKDTITRCRPFLFIEFLKSDKRALASKIVAFDYQLHEFGDNFLAVPTELAPGVEFA